MVRNLLHPFLHSIVCSHICGNLKACGGSCSEQVAVDVQEFCQSHLSIAQRCQSGWNRGLQIVHFTVHIFLVVFRVFIINTQPILDCSKPTDIERAIIVSLQLFTDRSQPIYPTFTNVDPALREAARGMGMAAHQRLFRVEIPIAVPVIMSGVRVAVVMNIGVTAIAAYIGAGGLGAFISRGISQTDPRQLITGALAVSILAVVADFALLGLQRLLTSPGLRQT